ncbi:hypothetical protein EHO60_06475 [Leptospira fletcheri]|uniref:Glucanase n=1 Tax=Leptospira fletcheri TaxID=2484981 RepID=A0A4R9GH18_9LEPT|nr:hypothetical protein [Leptospira fletcheri]TGK11927.1 hypothetical protein EHO60_06475 [Leptospira fletcheri]
MRKFGTSFGKISLSFFLLLLNITPLFPEKASFVLNSFHTKDLRLKKSDNGTLIMDLAPRDRKQGADLFFDFEEEQAGELQDKTGGYRVLSSSYMVDESQSHTGKRSARFAGKRSGIKISGKTKGILTSSDLKEEYYISLFLLPGTLDKEATLLNKGLYTRGKRFGWDLKIKDEIPVLEFYNFFEKENKTFSSLKIVGRERISRSKWNHLVIHFRPMQREIVFYVNGKENDRATLPRRESIVRIGFHPEDTTPFVLGENFYGWLDDFLTAKGAPDLEELSTPYSGQTYDQSSFTAGAKFGTAVSPVYKTKYTNSVPEGLTLKAKIPKSSFLELYFRFSPRPFPRSGEDGPNWKSVDLRKLEDYLQEDLSSDEETETPPAQRKFQTYKIPLDKNLPRFKYFQAKLKFKSDASGNTGPELESLSFSYNENLPPVKPMGLQVVYMDDAYPDTGSPRVCLSWTPNPEKEVRGKAGGYVIHYGVGPNRMVGILKGTRTDLEKGKMPVLSISDREKHPMSEYLDPVRGEDPSCPNKQKTGGQKLCQCIDNRLISLNAEKPEEDKHKLSKGKKKKPISDPYDKKLLFLQKGLTFYFKIAAYNSLYDPADGADQISPLSDPVEVYFLSE